MSSKKVLILCYSGSGNTKKMAKATAEAMKSSVIDVAVEDAGKFDISSLPKYDATVLGSPTYFSNVAWQIKKVIDESIIHYGGNKSSTFGISVCEGCRREQR
jgi:NAD(P)H dehydrogenase (quinone)